MSGEIVTAAALVIGNEILSGRTQDANLAYLGQQLNLLGIRLREAVTNSALQDAAAAEGLLTVAAGMNVLRLAPSLIITDAEADEVVALLDRACLRVAPQKVAAQ